MVLQLKRQCTEWQLPRLNNDSNPRFFLNKRRGAAIRGRHDTTHPPPPHEAASDDNDQKQVQQQQRQLRADKTACTLKTRLSYSPLVLFQAIASHNAFFSLFVMWYNRYHARDMLPTVQHTPRRAMQRNHPQLRPVSYICRKRSVLLLLLLVLP